MGFFTKVLGSTLQENKKVAAVVIAGALFIISLIFVTYQVNRWWNWNVGGYKARAQTEDHALVCEMGEQGAFQPNFNWRKYCD